jgi:transposase
LKEGKVFAPLTFQRACNRDLFETWLEKSLIPQLQPGNIIIIDNATFDKGQSIKEIVEEAGCPKGLASRRPLGHMKFGTCLPTLQI